MKIFIFLIFISSPLFAREIRQSSVFLEYQKDEGSYTSLAAGLTLGISKEIAIGFSHTTSKDSTTSSGTSSGNQKSRDTTLFANWKSDPVALRGSLEKTSEPNELEGTGFGLGASYTLSHLWDGDNFTVLKLDFGVTKYIQNQTSSLGNVGILVVDTNFNQYRTKLTLEQDITEFVTAGVSYTKYTYENASTAGLSSRFPVLNRTASYDAASAYSKNSSTVFLLIYPLSWLDFDLSATDTTSNTEGNDSKTIDIITNFAINKNWDFSLNYSNYHSGETIHYYGPSITFKW